MAVKLIKQELIFADDIMRESQDTIREKQVVRDIKEENKDRSMFDDLEIEDCGRTLQAHDSVDVFELASAMAFTEHESMDYGFCNSQLGESLATI